MHKTTTVTKFLYSSETWTLGRKKRRKDDFNRLKRKFVRKKLPKIFSLSQTKNEDVTQELKTDSPYRRIKDSKRKMVQTLGFDWCKTF